MKKKKEKKKRRGTKKRRGEEQKAKRKQQKEDKPEESDNEESDKEGETSDEGSSSEAEVTSMEKPGEAETNIKSPGEASFPVKSSYSEEEDDQADDLRVDLNHHLQAETLQTPIINKKRKNDAIDDPYETPKKRQKPYYEMAQHISNFLNNLNEPEDNLEFVKARKYAITLTEQLSPDPKPQSDLN